MAGQHQEAVLMVERPSATLIQGVPTLNGFSGKVAVQPIVGIVHPHHPADVIGRRQRVRNRAGVNHGDGVAPASKF